MVAGDLAFLRDTYVTKSGRNVNLRIYAKENQIDQCSYAMHALKRAMKWDEDEYNREYDLDLFMIVAIDHFNMGAMENKGLNIFNSKYILADSKTATDRDYDFIERIVAHEYFHNWTGNRITCRDWFQLCLKEGLTVFRDQQFSADMRYEPVKRIEDVINLKTRQFREDDGPLAHPVRPNEYLEINNFYTATVYEKGAEIVRMLQLIAGSNRYKMCIQEFFDQHDGRACAVEDWLDVFAKGLKMDLEQFSLWYSVKGRPTVNIQDSYINGEYTLKFSQNINVESGLENSPAMLIPITLGLLDKKGNELRKSQQFCFQKGGNI